MRLRVRIHTRPTVPGGASAPASSRTAMATPGTGRPIEPRLMTPEGGLSVARPTSVIP